MIDKDRIACAEQPANSMGGLLPLTAAERVQLTRNRKKKDLLLVTLEIRASERAALIHRGFLALDKATSRPRGTPSMLIWKLYSTRSTQQR
jgi:hypothetical protein